MRTPCRRRRRRAARRNVRRPARSRAGARRARRARRHRSRPGAAQGHRRVGGHGADDADARTRVGAGRARPRVPGGRDRDGSCSRCSRKATRTPAGRGARPSARGAGAVSGWTLPGARARRSMRCSLPTSRSRKAGCPPTSRCSRRSSSRYAVRRDAPPREPHDVAARIDHANRRCIVSLSSPSLALLVGRLVRRERRAVRERAGPGVRARAANGHRRPGCRRARRARLGARRHARWNAALCRGAVLARDA